ncbi:MAG: basic secretory protein-like protein [Limisphaerales bacterium]
MSSLEPGSRRSILIATVTAAFLAWLVEKHDPEIVRKLNTASRRRQPASPVFLEATGKAIDVLWREYADGFRRPPQP